MTADRIEALLAHIEANPDDVDAYAILADVLQQAGDPRGELVQIQLTQAEHYRAAAERKLLYQKVDLWSLDLRCRELIAARRPLALGDLAEDPSLDLEYRLGFVDAVSSDGKFSVGGAAHGLVELFASPESRLLRGIRLARGHEKCGGAIKAILRHLVASRAHAPSALDTLDLALRGRDPDDVSDTLAAVPNLVDLRVATGGDVVWAPLVSTRLRRLSWRARYIAADALEPVAASELPALEAFELWPGARFEHRFRRVNRRREEVGPPVLVDQLDADDLEPIFTMLGRARQLRSLALCNYAGDLATVLRRLAERAWIGGLETLDLSQCVLDDPAALEDVVARATSLTRLRLERTVMSSVARARLAATGIVVEGNPPAQRPTHVPEHHRVDRVDVA